LATCEICAEADKEVHREERKDFYESLPFDRTVFSKLAAIGRCPALYNPEVETSLPPNYSILHIARKLTSEELDRAIAQGVISPDTNRAELDRWISNPTNCRYQALVRDTHGGTSFHDAAKTEQMLKSLINAFEGSAALLEQWQRAPHVVRMAFVRELKKL
jgi:hypothetical protein